MESLVVDIKGLSKLLGGAGRLPAAVRLGRSKRWRVEEVRDWLIAGAPSRVAWEAREEWQNARRPAQGTPCDSSVGN